MDHCAPLDRLTSLMNLVDFLHIDSGFHLIKNKNKNRNKKITASLSNEQKK